MFEPEVFSSNLRHRASDVEAMFTGPSRRRLPLALLLLSRSSDPTQHSTGSLTEDAYAPIWFLKFL